MNMEIVDHVDNEIVDANGEVKEIQALAPYAGSDISIMPITTMDNVQMRYDMLKEFIRSNLTDKVDYGTIPGCGDKPVLLQPGAQKLKTFFGLEHHFEIDKEIFDLDRDFFYYRYRCVLTRNNLFAGDGMGSCNSREKKYGYRWVNVLPSHLDKNKVEKRETLIGEYGWAIDRGTTTGQYGKPPEYWQRFRKAIQDGTAKKTQKPNKDGKLQDFWEVGGTEYRIPNPEVYDELNTIEKMGMKRAFIHAILATTGSSQFFTQDLEDKHPTQETAATNSNSQPLAGSKPPDEDPAMKTKIVADITALVKELKALNLTVPPKPEGMKVIAETPYDLFVTYLNSLRDVKEEWLETSKKYSKLEDKYHPAFKAIKVQMSPVDSSKPIDEAEADLKAEMEGALYDLLCQAGKFDEHFNGDVGDIVNFSIGKVVNLAEQAHDAIRKGTEGRD